ncbi:MAG: penicillin amidase [Bacteroidetes bacterium QS_1_63_11]|nr:MAG: penicillin amidase [Bacteroidetes bacterium QS_1_63_11]
MSQRLYAGLALVLLLAAGALAWWVWSGPRTNPPARQSINGLTDTASVEWTTGQTAVLDVEHGTDALTALGYVHGMMRPWTVTVWRRTALGRLSASFGAALVPIDRHARRLGFGHHARRAYDRLPRAEQRRLEAYTRGLNAALRSDRVQSRDRFLYLNLQPQRWAPWHPLAVERLLAWTDVELEQHPSESQANARADFRAADHRLRRWLHLHGRSRSVAWAARSPENTARTALFTRHVLGATADPVIQEVTVRRANHPPAALASLPGAPIFPTGTTGSRAWTYLLDSAAQFRRVQVDTTQARVRHERIAPVNGDERLVTIRQYGEGLVIDSTASDSTWVLRWPGLRARSDVPRWLRVANLSGAPDTSEPPPFALHKGSGLTVNHSGAWTVRGQPAVVDRGPNFVFVGRSPWARHQADALQAQTGGVPLAPAQWSVSDSSTWAARLLPRLRPALEPIADTDSTVDEARSYLRNWDFVYEPASIGAVVFERWMLAYTKQYGRRPSATTLDSVTAVRYREAFRQAIADLTDQYGTDVRQWRWERVAAQRRQFPVWSADSLVATDLSSLSTTRFAALDQPGRGHASALSGGPTLGDRPRLGPAPASWEGWTWSDSPNLTVRRLRFDPSDFLARSLLSRERPNPVSVSEAPTQRTTQLVPAAPEKDEP